MPINRSTTASPLWFFSINPLGKSRLISTVPNWMINIGNPCQTNWHSGKRFLFELLSELASLVNRKFANTLDILVHSLDHSVDTFEEDQATVTLTTNPKLKISTVNIPLIDGFGSLKAPPFSSDTNTETPSIPQELIDLHHPCSTNDDCKSNVSSLLCKSGRCSCPENLFWSSSIHRCLTCHDLFLGNRCFRLLNHKLTWYQAHDYCQNDNPIDDEQEYTMKLASKLERTDIESLKQAFFHQNNYEADYIYWIGATSYSDMRKLHQLNLKTRRQVPTVAFHWYDDAQGALIDMKDVRCPQMTSSKREDISDNERCVGITSCGLYADDCQRNNRFICEATWTCWMFVSLANKNVSLTFGSTGKCIR